MSSSEALAKYTGQTNFDDLPPAVVKAVPVLLPLARA